MNDGDWGVLTYTFDDVVAALDGGLSVRLGDLPRHPLPRARRSPPPLAGIEQAGYRLVWKDEPNPYEKGRIGGFGLRSTCSIRSASTLDKDGKVTATLWGSPAFDAGVVNTAQIVAVNGEAYSADAHQAAITAAKDGSAPIELLVKRGDRYLDGAGRLPRRAALAVARARRQRRAGARPAARAATR